MDDSLTPFTQGPPKLSIHGAMSMCHQTASARYPGQQNFAASPPSNRGNSNYGVPPLRKRSSWVDGCPSDPGPSHPSDAPMKSIKWLTANLICKVPACAVQPCSVETALILSCCTPSNGDLTFGYCTSVSHLFKSIISLRLRPSLPPPLSAFCLLQGGVQAPSPPNQKTSPSLCNFRLSLTVSWRRHIIIVPCLVARRAKAMQRQS
ncbi:hypothetical protein B0I35DRAFT_229659 [Stachybotrys elegans]|uniref:Uncharacterized protein n=1 Tax=Stachybotrys elegans TaxID=80388 RepID=A0A8K0SX34_9HYPO|nr:hypothetical protein B0I35DRAFT_229659 [Stachybotrys elegans]